MVNSSNDFGPFGAKFAVNFLNGLKIKAKLALLLSVSAAALIATLALGASVLHQKMVDDREQQTRRLTAVAVSLVESWYGRIASGRLEPRGRAKRRHRGAPPAALRQRQLLLHPAL
jgi:hypothetical protein